MSKNVTVSEQDYTGVAKVKLPITGSEEYAEYVAVEGEKEIVENGTHDVSQYATVSVNVPSESGGTTVEGVINITENGSHDVSQYAIAIVNVESAKVGELTMYQQVKITPEKSGLFVIQHSLGIVPKHVIIIAHEDSVAWTTGGVNRAYISNSILHGFAKGINASTVKVSTGSLDRVSEAVTENSPVGQYYIDNEQIRIVRPQANILWETDTEYTVDIYA